jgi:hypothetical protein
MAKTPATNEKHGVGFSYLRVFILCYAGAIRSMYHEVFSAIRVELAA